MRDYQQYFTGERIDGMFGAVGIIGSFIGMFTGMVLPTIYQMLGLEDNYDVLRSRFVQRGYVRRAHHRRSYRRGAQLRPLPLLRSDRDQAARHSQGAQDTRDVRGLRQRYSPRREHRRSHRHNRRSKSPLQRQNPHDHKGRHQEGRENTARENARGKRVQEERNQATRKPLTKNSTLRTAA